ncbi:VOC family protein, partial [Agrococcus versicolor]|uniref:VOC family protein n=1 Tax=Agrococcus versicolor TaxID=501482 RepID=UPI0031D35BA0
MDAWRTLDGRPHAWFASPSHAAGAALLARIVETAGRVVDVDVRSRGVRVRLLPGDAGLSPAIDAAAAGLGLIPEPHRLQTLRLVLETPDPERVAPFWLQALGYERSGDDLVDPWQRDLPIRLVRDRDERPLRERLHVDVVRPAAALAAAAETLGAAAGPWGVRHADADGIELDAVPGDTLAGAPDWWTLFAAVARFAVPSPAVAVALAAE